MYKLSIHLLFASFICLFSPHTLAEPSAIKQVEVRKITPPKLDSAHLGKRITAYRPMRHGSPNLSVEQLGNKVIINDYGHGGSGWSLAPGSVAYVNQLLSDSPLSSDLKKNTPITIIGAGIIGLLTAYELVEKGYTNITLIAEQFDDTTSHNAGGLLAPASMDNNPEMQKIVDKIGLDSYSFYKKIIDGKAPRFKNAAAVMPIYCDNKDSCGLEPFVNKVMSPAKNVVLDFGNGTTRKMLAYDDAIFIDTSLMMQQLYDTLKPRVQFIQKKVNSFNEIESKYIFNCAGLGAGHLNQDKSLVPVQGHLVMLKDQNPLEMKYSILVYFDKKDKTKTGQTVKRSFYLIPKHLPGTSPYDVGVLGGTYIEGATPETPNPEQFDIIIQEAREFYGVR